MVDLNVMMRDAARSGLQVQLDTAVTNGDAEAAAKIVKDMEALAVSTAPKAPPYGQTDILAEMNKLDWFGTDPKKSQRAVELGKSLDPKKFATAALFSEALVKAVNEEFKPAPAAGAAAGEEDDDDGEEGGDDAAKAAAAAAKAKRKTDGPGEGDAGQGTVQRGSKGPWVKMADAPADVQKDIKRQADKFVSSSAPKEQREKFIANALASHYNAVQLKKGKK